MPGSDHGPSILNPSVYDALRRKGYSKGKAARISNSKRRTRKRASYRDALWVARIFKATYYDVRNDSGKFSESPGGGGKKPKPAPKRKGTRQEIANQNRAAMAEQLGVGAELDGALARLEAGMGGRADEAKAEQLAERGLAVKDPATGRYSLSPEGKAYMRAAKKGDTEAATAALGNAKGRAEKTKAKADAAAGKAKGKEQAAADKAKAEAEKPKGGGGGGGKPSPEDKAKEQAAAKAKQREANRSQVAQAMADSDQGLAPGGAKALTEFADGGQIDEQAATALTQMGLLAQDSAGQYRMTPEGRSTVRAMDTGNLRGALDSISAARDKRSTAAKFVQFDADALAKADDEQRLVYGVATSEDLDIQGGIWRGQRYDGDIVDAAAVTEALGDYMQWANIREMHDAKAVGTVVDAKMVDGQLRIVARIEDGDAWHKIKTGVYKGFSIGGKALKAVLAKLADGRIARRILKLLLTEISLVDRPANPAARILLFKGADMPSDVETPEQTGAAALAALTALADLAKAAPDPMKATAMLQAIRDELELSGDVEGAALMTQAISLVLQAAGEAEAPAGEAPEAEPAEAEPAEDMEMLAEEEEDPAAIAMSARAAIRKAARMRMGKRLPGIEAIAKQVLQLAADAGSEWAIKLMKSDAPTDMKTVAAELQKTVAAELTKAMQPIAAGVLHIHERTARLEAQPTPGGPARNLTAISKRLATVEIERTAGSPAPEADEIARLRRLAAVEVNAAAKQHYQTELARLEAAQR